MDFKKHFLSFFLVFPFCLCYSSNIFPQCQKWKKREREEKKKKSYARLTPADCKYIWRKLAASGWRPDLIRGISWLEKRKEKKKCKIFISIYGCLKYWHKSFFSYHSIRFTNKYLFPTCTLILIQLINYQSPFQVTSIECHNRVGQLINHKINVIKASKRKSNSKW